LREGDGIGNEIDILGKIIFHSIVNY
jgi:hypothetical protein